MGAYSQLKFVLPPLLSAAWVLPCSLADDVCRVWEQKHPVPRPLVNSSHSMVYDESRGVCVLFGGLPENGDTWEWDGSTWVLRNVPGPSPRSSHAMAYDSHRAVTVLHGGSTGSYETWEFDGTNWSLRALDGPLASFHAMAFDSDRGVTVLFHATQTWEWDGTTWAQRATTGPSERKRAAMAYDPIRGVTVLFGGMDLDAHVRGDTWHWNGTVWTVQSEPLLGPRIGAPLAFDSHRNLVVRFGGSPDGSDPFNGTYERADDWVRVPTFGSPPPVWEHAFAYDSRRHAMVLYSGHCNLVPEECPYYQTWEMRVFRACDLNCDGSVNGFDIEPFVEALSPDWPGPCSPCAADANADGSINLFDIDAFVACLGG